MRRNQNRRNAPRDNVWMEVTLKASLLSTTLRKKESVVLCLDFKWIILSESSGRIPFGIAWFSLENKLPVVLKQYFGA